MHAVCGITTAFVSFRSRGTRIGLLAATLLIALWQTRAADTEGVAIALVLDNSGSMKEPVRTANGDYQAKWLIANRALLDVISRIESFATNPPPGLSRKVEAGLFIFTASGAVPAVKFGAFDPEAMRAWVKSYRGPSTATPLGAAINVASQAVLDSPLASRHVLVLTDGVNTVGPSPPEVITRLQRTAAGRSAVVFVHCVAFDVDAKVFAPLKKLGVTVVGAADEKQLGQQLEFILEEKILLEKESSKK
jgi:hypothetical protein